MRRPLGITFTYGLRARSVRGSPPHFFISEFRSVATCVGRTSSAPGDRGASSHLAYVFRRLAFRHPFLLLHLLLAHPLDD